MDIRETLRNKPQIGISIIAVVILIVSVVVWRTVRSGSIELSMPPKVYYSDDDGKTFYIDDSANIPPYDHAGKTAVQAAVFKCNGKDPFVAYLVRYSHGAKAELDGLSESERRGSSPKVLGIKATNEMVKKPGDKNWISLNGNSPAGDILNPQCPDGSEDRPTQILP